MFCLLMTQISIERVALVGSLAEQYPEDRYPVGVSKRG